MQLIQEIPLMKLSCVCLTAKEIPEKVIRQTHMKGHSTKHIISTRQNCQLSKTIL